MDHTFYNCSNLTILDLSNLDITLTSNVINVFYGCNSLVYLYLSNIETTIISNFSFLFNNLSELIVLNLSNFKGSIVNNTLDFMFNNCINLISLDLSSFDISNTTNMSYMFNNCNSLEDLRLYSFYKSSVTDFSYMFNNCTSLKSLDLSNFQGSIALNTMHYMFNNCINLMSIDLSGLDILFTTNMSFMFNDCESLTDLKLNSINTTICSDFSNMFTNCLSLITLDLSSFHGSIVDNTMESMFINCINLQSLDLSNLDISYTYKVINMFSGCINIEYLNLSSFSVSKADNFSHMFNDCGKLQSLDLSNFKGSSKENSMEFMFSNCNNLKYLDLSSLDTSLTKTMSFMFNGCNSLTNLKLSDLNTSYVDDYSYMFNNCSLLTSIDLSKLHGSLVSNTMEYMFNNCKNLLYLDLSNFDVSFTRNMSYMFNNCNSLLSIDIPDLNISSAKDLSYMFNNCSSLLTFNLSSFKTSSTINTMEFMFNNCKSLISMDLSFFNTSYSSNMKGLFNNCTSLEYLELLNFDGSSVTDFSYMFNNCISLKSLDLTHFNKLSTSNNMAFMFYNCNKLSSLNLSKFDTSKTNNMSSLFSGCHSLSSLDLSYFKTSNVKNMKEMFANCDNLLSLDLFIFDTSSVTDMTSMFINCIKLKDLKIFNFKTSSVEKMDSMLCNCQSLLSLDFSKFETKSLNSMSKMFQNCSSLIILDLSNFDTSLVTDMSLAFSGCKNLEFLDIMNFSEENLLNTTDMFYLTRENLIFCNNKFENKSNSSISKSLNSKLCQRNICEANWKDYQTKYIPAINDCISDCKDHNNYNYEFKGFCYPKCPENTRSTLDDDFLCEVICTEEKPYEIILLYECVQNCSSFNFFTKVCKINYRVPKIKDDMTFNIDEDVPKGALDLLISGPIKRRKEDFLVKSGEMYFQMTSSENQNNKTYDNISKMEIGVIENKIKGIYNISEKENLIIFKTDVMRAGYYIPIVEYSIYNVEKNEKLDLNNSEIENIKINLSLPVKINETKLYKYDPFSEYYNDLCFTETTDNGTDIIMNDRFESFAYYNYSLCEKNCKYKGYDSKNKKAICECKIKNELRIFSKIIIDKDLLFNNFLKLNSTMNIDIIKCYYIVFTYDGLIKNIGSYTILAIFLIFIVTFVLFFTIGYNKLYLQICQISSVKFYEGEKNEIEKKKKIKPQIIENSENSNSNSGNKLKLIKDDESIRKVHEKEQKKKLNIQRKQIMKATDKEINSLPYDKALQYDNRTFFQYYFSLLRTKHLLIFSFYPSNDYNLMITKRYLFFFSFALYFTINALFFTDKTMHKIYEDKGMFNFIYQIPQILYSTILSSISSTLIQHFALTEKNLLEIKNQTKTEKLASAYAKAIKYTFIKFIVFSFFNIIFLGIFWYYLACFCAVYKNTQIHLVSDTVISFGLSLVYPLGINLLPGFFRITALKDKNKKKECLYKLSKLIQII